MSLVAYGSSDESSEDESTECPKTDDANSTVEVNGNTSTGQKKLHLPAPKSDNSKNEEDEKSKEQESERIHFEMLPKPKVMDSVIEEDEDIPRKVEVERTVKKDRAPIKITVPSLSEFQDIEEENDRKKDRIMPSQKGTGLFALLPPPKGAEVKSSNTLVPQVVARKAEISQVPVKKVEKTNNVVAHNTVKTTSRKSLELSTYNSNSEDEDDAQGNEQPTTDFFALSSNSTETDAVTPDLISTELKDKFNVPVHESNLPEETTHNISKDSSENRDKTLVSNVMNLPKEEILLKNKAAVGPKLPVPEQEYNIDQEGNVAIDEKAIEYLCGRRGIKRKNKEIEEANIIEINGEDIKPDEREWLVKALTEEPIQRPVSIGGGVNSQSKKKHQITYLAHQAKAMEMELKNQWAQNRMTRKQTQSKYGF